MAGDGEAESWNKKEALSHAEEPGPGGADPVTWEPMQKLETES